MLTEGEQAGTKHELSFSRAHCFESGFGGRDEWLRAITAAVADKGEMRKLSWPWWAPWALLAVVVTSILTIVVTVYTV